MTGRPIRFVFNAGGLCNRLFPFANLFAYSQESRRKLINPVFGSAARYFVGTNPSYFPSFAQSQHDSVLFPRLNSPAWKARFALTRRLLPSLCFSRIDSEAIDLDGTTSDLSQDIEWISALYVLGNESFRKHSALIRSYFRPIPPIESDVDAFLSKSRSDADLLVGIHIRQGDYAQHAGGMLHYETSEYRSLMDSALKVFPDRNLKFIVCSNTPQSSAMFEGLRWTMGPGDEIRDLMALAGCDYIIGPASTYSQWASFYGEVPLFVHNRKYEQMYGLPMKQMSLQSFEIHRVGYGKF
jgi:hypothetical protein